MTTATTHVTENGVSELQEKFEELAIERDQLRAELAEACQGLRRHRLPDTRESITHKFSISGHEGYITVGLYEDSRPGEVFLTVAKQGSTLRGLLDTVAVLTSLSLQYGVPVEALARKFAFSQFEPSGHTTNPDIRVASSITDYVFRWLGRTFSEEFRNEDTARSQEASKT